MRRSSFLQPMRSSFGIWRHAERAATNGRGREAPAGVSQRFFSVSMPLTLPRQVSPAYGTVIESVPSLAVPASVIAHDVRPGAVALPDALHLISVGDVNRPSAVPVSFRSLGHVALNEPFAERALCSVTFHLKSVHVPGVGIRVDDVQLPTRELLPATVGSVNELFRSNPAQPAAVMAAIENTVIRIRFFIALSQE